MFIAFTTGTEMTFQELLDHFGDRQKDVVEALGVTKGTVSVWASSGIPYSTQCVIEVETGGALKAKKADAPQPTDKAA